MVRTIFKPNTSRINLSIPAEYIGEEVEILVFPIKNTENPHTSVINDVEENNTKRTEYSILSKEEALSMTAEVIEKYRPALKKLAE